MDKIVEFIISKMPAYAGKEEEIKKVINSHIQYGTFDYEEDEKGIIYCMRYNILPSGKVVHILDLCVRKKSYKLIKYIIIKNLMRWPSLEVIRYVRGYKDNREHNLKIEDVLRKEIKWAAELKHR